MRAEPGDWLVIKSPVIGQPARRGQIIEVRSPDGAPPYLVHWLEDDRITLVFPGPDGHVAAAAEQAAADERARHRFERLQEEIAHHR
ncbi:MULTISPECIES: DUF1918 domain-containing protein [Amycolatopsis]|uniref:DUF1918 domain-containing protein n=1 Tax=Amycolatopsis tucumanensis TaxID=401106 RepID=A0ABP7HKM9_9PSEU|nr:MULTISPECIES: DUF1918 domain-containing protein [Amycolatopsis]MCF6420653.1 DUF1918 domain-containing protein [Amycolatopsis tucumanensis]